MDMLSSNVYVYGVILYLAAAASPGPNIALLVEMSLQKNCLRTCTAAAGIASVSTIYASMAMFGLCHINEIALTVTQLLGCAYLIYLGLKNIIVPINAKRFYNDSKFGPFLTGAFINITNPKTIAFFTTLFATSAHQVNTNKAIFLSVISACGFSFYVGIAIILTRSWVNPLVEKYAIMVKKIVGCIFIVISFLLINNLLKEGII